VNFIFPFTISREFSLNDRENLSVRVKCAVFGASNPRLELLSNKIWLSRRCHPGIVQGNAAITGFILKTKSFEICVYPARCPYDLPSERSGFISEVTYRRKGWSLVTEIDSAAV
jgi:hypothetical protein